MSEARRKISVMVPDPWVRYRRDWPNVPIRRRAMGDRWEEVVWTRKGAVILLHDALTAVQERAALTHALEHLDRGQTCEPLRWQIERAVEQATARWLIPEVDLFGAAWAACGDLARVAWEFNVPPFVVEHRLEGLNEDERTIIDKHRDAVA